MSCGHGFARSFFAFVSAFFSAQTMFKERNQSKGGVVVEEEKNRNVVVVEEENNRNVMVVVEENSRNVVVVVEKS